MNNKEHWTLKKYGNVLYKIYTEDAHRKSVIRPLQSAEFPEFRDGRLPGFTLLPGIGDGEGQDGKIESSLVCDVVVPYSPETDRKMRDVVEDIRRENADQAVVLIVRVPCVPEMIWRKGSAQSGDQVQSKFQFAGEGAQEIRPPAELGLACQKSLARKKVGKIVARIGEWKKLLHRNKLRLRANSRDRVEFKSPVLQNLIKRATAGG